MLKKILSISGRPGLFKLVSQAKGALIVEALSTGKRTLAYSHDKVTSLGDIAMYTQSGEEPLYKVLDSVKKKKTVLSHLSRRKPIKKFCVLILLKYCPISIRSEFILPTSAN